MQLLDLLLQEHSLEGVMETIIMEVTESITKI